MAAARQGLERGPTGELLLGGVSLSAVAREVGTPAYVYDLDAMAAEARALRDAFDDAPHLVAYAVKANAAGPVVRALASEGCGADVVSGGEMALALECGIEPDRIVYNGVAKLDCELDRAIACGPRGIGAVQLESIEEIARVEARAGAAGRIARVSVRVNPGVDVGQATHAHIATGHDAAKFGVPREDLPRAVEMVRGSPHLRLVGLATHVGSQIPLEHYLASARVLFELARAVREQGGASSLAFVDTGGGFGVDYAGGAPAKAADFVRAARAEQRAHRLDDLALHVEPGRVLVAAHGVLLARTVQWKFTAAVRWLMLDAGMNDLLRPALYQARHRVTAIDREATAEESVPWRVVGPVCESSDDFGEHSLPREPPWAVAILDAGAYGYVMASRYNGRQAPVEVFVRGGRVAGKTGRASPDEWARERARAGEDVPKEG